MRGWRGFLAGSLALIVLYVAVQPGTADKATVGGNVLVALMQHALSAQVAGISDHSGTDGGAHAQHALQSATQAVAQTKVQQAGQAIGDALNQMQSN